MVYSIPYAVVATGMALSWRFNRSRTFFILLVIALAYWSVGSLIPSYPAFLPPTAHIDFIQGALCLLLPLNFVLFSWMKEDVKSGFGLVTEKESKSKAVTDYATGMR